MIGAHGMAEADKCFLQWAEEVIEANFRGGASATFERLKEAVELGEIPVLAASTWDGLYTYYELGHDPDTAFELHIRDETAYEVSRMAPEEVRSQGGVLKVQDRIREQEKAYLSGLIAAGFSPWLRDVDTEGPGRGTAL